MFPNYSYNNGIAAIFHILEVVWLCYFDINKKEYLMVTKNDSSYNKYVHDIKYLSYYKIYNFKMKYFSCKTWKHFQST
jgi:hypothetical protein